VWSAERIAAGATPVIRLLPSFLSDVIFAGEIRGHLTGVGIPQDAVFQKKGKHDDAHREASLQGRKRRERRGGPANGTPRVPLLLA